MNNPDPDRHMKSLQKEVCREQGGAYLPGGKGKMEAEVHDKNRGSDSGGNKPPKGNGGY
jgi:hypothetical protein